MFFNKHFPFKANINLMQALDKLDYTYHNLGVLILRSISCTRKDIKRKVKLDESIQYFHI